MTGKIFLWGGLAATLLALYYLRGDITRYTKMKMM